jgi:hypothetical protein
MKLGKSALSPSFFRSTTHQISERFFEAACGVFGPFLEYLPMDFSAPGKANTADLIDTCTVTFFVLIEVVNIVERSKGNLKVVSLFALRQQVAVARHAPIAGKTSRACVAKKGFFLRPGRFGRPLDADVDGVF